MPVPSKNGNSLDHFANLRPKYSKHSEVSGGVQEVEEHTHFLLTRLPEEPHLVLVRELKSLGCSTKRFLLRYPEIQGNAE